MAGLGCPAIRDVASWIAASTHPNVVPTQVFNARDDPHCLPPAGALAAGGGMPRSSRLRCHRLSTRTPASLRPEKWPRTPALVINVLRDA